MGQQRFEKLMKKSKFPWVLSNVIDNRTSKPFVNAHTKVVVDVGEIRVCKNYIINNNFLILQLDIFIREGWNFRFS